MAGMGKTGEMIAMTLRLLKATEKKAADNNQAEGVRLIRAKVEGYRMGLKTRLRPEYVDAVFEKEGF